MTILVNLVPLVIGAAVGGPMWIIMALLLLRSDHGLVKAAAFAGGAITVRLLQFVLFSRIFGAVLESGGESELDLTSSILLLLAGIVLLITAVKTWFKETDPDAPPLRWLAALSGISVPAAFGMAVVMMFLGFKQWVFTLSAIAIIDEAEIGKIGSVVVYILFILAAQALMLAPIIGSALAPGKSSKIVGAMLAWLERNSRTITIVVSLVFAVWFLSNSAVELLTQRSGHSLQFPDRALIPLRCAASVSIHPFKNRFLVHSPIGCHAVLNSTVSRIQYGSSALVPNQSAGSIE